MPVYENDIRKKFLDAREENIYYAEQLSSLLEMERKPVGIEFYYTEEEFERSHLEPTEYKMSYCVFVEKASRIGMACKTKFENHYCDGGTTALGLENPSQEIRSGRIYHSYGLYKTKGIAQKVWNEVAALPANEMEIFGIGIAPLETFDSQPDVCIVIGSPLSAMRITQGSLYGNGERLSMDIAAMQGVCSEVTATPYLTGKINVSLLCPSTRSLAKWKPDELMTGIPYHLLDDLIDGITEVKKVK